MVNTSKVEFNKLDKNCQPKKPLTPALFKRIPIEFKGRRLRLPHQGRLCPDVYGFLWYILRNLG